MAEHNVGQVVEEILDEASRPKRPLWVRVVAATIILAGAVATTLVAWPPSMPPKAQEAAAQPTHDDNAILLRHLDTQAATLERLDGKMDKVVENTGKMEQALVKLASEKADRAETEALRLEVQKLKDNKADRRGRR